MEHAIKKILNITITEQKYKSQKRCSSPFPHCHIFSHAFSSKSQQLFPYLPVHFQSVFSPEYPKCIHIKLLPGFLLLQKFPHLFFHRLILRILKDLFRPSLYLATSASIETCFNPSLAVLVLTLSSFAERMHPPMVEFNTTAPFFEALSLQYSCTALNP